MFTSRKMLASSSSAPAASVGASGVAQSGRLRITSWSKKEGRRSIDFVPKVGLIACPLGVSAALHPIFNAISSAMAANLSRVPCTTRWRIR